MRKLVVMFSLCPQQSHPQSSQKTRTLCPTSQVPPSCSWGVGSRHASPLNFCDGASSLLCGEAPPFPSFSRRAAEVGPIGDGAENSAASCWLEHTAEPAANDDIALLDCAGRPSSPGTAGPDCIALQLHSGAQSRRPHHTSPEENSLVLDSPRGNSSRAVSRHTRRPALHVCAREPRRSLCPSSSMVIATNRSCRSIPQKKK